MGHERAHTQWHGEGRGDEQLSAFSSGRGGEMAPHPRENQETLKHQKHVVIGQKPRLGEVVFFLIRTLR